MISCKQTIVSEGLMFIYIRSNITNTESNPSQYYDIALLKYFQSHLYTSYRLIYCIHSASMSKNCSVSLSLSVVP